MNCFTLADISTMESLGISILSGFIVIVGIFICKGFWDWWLVNVWLKLTCRHIIDISGEWECETKFAEEGLDSEWTESIILKQYGWKIKGDINHKYKDNNVRDDKDYSFKGIFREGILSCYYWNKKKDKKGVGGFTLELKGDGDTFEGRQVYYNPDSNKIESNAYKWERRKNL